MKYELVERKMPSILVLLLLLLVSITLFDAIPQFLTLLVTILSIFTVWSDIGLISNLKMILPLPSLPVHAKSRMPEPDPGFSSRLLNMPILDLMPPYRALPDPESTLQTVPKKNPILTCPATDELVLHSTNEPHTTGPRTRRTIQSIAAVPETLGPTTSASTVQCSLDRLQDCLPSLSHRITGTAENSGSSRIYSGSSSEIYFDADTGTPGKLDLTSLDTDSDTDTRFGTITGSNGNISHTSAENKIPLNIVDDILSPLSVVKLMSDLQGADLDIRKAAASTLKCLSINPETAEIIATSCLRLLVDLIFSGDDAAISLAARILKDISADLPEKQRHLMADARVIPAMVEILSFCNIPHCRWYAVETLRNLTRGTRNSDGMRRLVVVEGGFKRLIKSLSGLGPYEVEAEALRYIAPAAPVALLVSQGIVPLMVHVLRHESSAARQVIATTIPSLPRSNRLYADFGKAGAIHLLTGMLDEDLTASHEAAARALCCLLRCNKNINKVRKDPACIAGLVRMLKSGTLRTGVVPAIGCLLNLAPVSKCREEMLAQGVTEVLKDLNGLVPGANKLLRRLEGGSWMEKLLCLA